MRQTRVSIHFDCQSAQQSYRDSPGVRLESNCVRLALRRPVTVSVFVLAIALSSILALVEMPGEYSADSRNPDDLHCAALRRPFARADGKLHHLLLRVSLSVYFRHRAHRVEKYRVHRFDRACSFIPARIWRRPRPKPSATSTVLEPSCRRGQFLRL